ncbi:cation diffusion facilitator family transporter [Desulfohalovibrio reitneri]|uniref:cation diffusion facilitator family transporter n=1 Tax=Desulfohalovibrio reitneri TaxID=1307759 RepID=UPI0005559AC9|nr:cation diffusion facilitator family transporter [Desulfohalovibrio reitneri]
MKQSVRKYVYVSLAASLLGLGLKVAAWLLTDSVGLFSDAAETVVNLSAALMALWAVSVAFTPPDKRHPFGHGKAEYFSSGMEGVLVLVASVGIAWAGVARFLDPRPLSSLGLGLGAALTAAAINWGAAKVMLRAAREYDSITLEADAKHLLTDVWTSGGIVAGLTIQHFLPPAFTILDPLMALAMAVNIAFTGAGLLKRSVGGLMDRSLPEEEVDALTEAVNRVAPDASAIHALRTRKSGNRRFAEFHLLLPGSTSVKEAHDVTLRMQECVAEELPRMSLLIHVEPLEEQDGERHGDPNRARKGCREDGD